MKGVYHIVPRNTFTATLQSLSFYNNRTALGVSDVARAERLAKGIVGKRLTYRMPRSAAI
jgi:hypothetical protein